MIGDILYLIAWLWAFLYDAFWFLFVGALVLGFFLEILWSLGQQWRTDTAMLSDDIIPGSEVTNDSQNGA